MKKVTKEEVKVLRERFPYVHIRRTIHNYYAEENPNAMRYLDKLKGTVDKVVKADAKA